MAGEYVYDNYTHSGKLAKIGKELDKIEETDEEDYQFFNNFQVTSKNSIDLVDKRQTFEALQNVGFGLDEIGSIENSPKALVFLLDRQGAYISNARRQINMNILPEKLGLLSDPSSFKEVVKKRFNPGQGVEGPISEQINWHQERAFYFLQDRGFGLDEIGSLENAPKAVQFLFYCQACRVANARQQLSMGILPENVKSLSDLSSLKKEVRKRFNPDQCYRKTNKSE